MDIIQQLPFPDEICHKIVLYAFKSPHTHLQEEIFKRVVPTHIYQKLVEKGGIEKVNGYITKVCVWDDENEQLLDYDDLESLQFDIQVLQGLQHLTTFNLGYTGFTGDIQVLQGLQNLTTFDLSDTDVTGDIQVLQGLPNLTRFFLNKGVTGDIQVLQELQNLTTFYLRNTGVKGDIQVLQGLQHLTEFYLESTGVTGDEEAFHEYRKSRGLEECEVYM